MKNKGSALIWVISTLLIFMILVAGIFVLVGSSHRSALRNNYKQQAYFTALSAVNIVAEGVKSSEKFPATTPESITVNAELTLPSSMGTAEVSINRLTFENADCVLIKATGDYLGVQDTVSLRLYSSGDSWVVWRYEK